MSGNAVSGLNCREKCYIGEGTHASLPEMGTYVIDFLQIAGAKAVRISGH